MRRIWITLLAIATALVITLPAGAVKPDNPGKPSPDEPDTIGGFTCIADPYTDIMFESDDFVINLGGKDTGLPSSVCVDVMTTVASRWQVTVTGSGGRSLGLATRDSHGPGDPCGGSGARGEEIYGQFTLPLEEDTFFDKIPAATVNACGTAFAEWIEPYPGEEESPPWDADAICSAVDPTNPEAPCGAWDKLTDHPHPLVLQATFAGSKDGTATVCIDLHPLEDPGHIPAACGGDL